MPHTLNDSHFLLFNLLKPCCPWHRCPPPNTAASSHPSRPSSLHPSFALLLSPDGNYLHKSVFALWFAPSHKWRLSLFNRGGFAGHVKAYNVAGLCFPPHYCDRPGPLGEGWDGSGGGSLPPRLRLTGPEEASALDQALDSFTWRRGEQEVVKSPLVKGLRIFRVCSDRMLLCLHTASRHVDGEGGIVQIRDHLLTSVQGLATAFVGVCLQWVVQHIVGVRNAEWRENRCGDSSAVASSLINTSWGAEFSGTKVNIDLEQLESLRASQVCAAATRARRHSSEEEPSILVAVVVLLL